MINEVSRQVQLLGFSADVTWEEQKSPLADQKKIGRWHYGQLHNKRIKPKVKKTTTIHFSREWSIF